MRHIVEFNSYNESAVNIEITPEIIIQAIGMLQSPPNEILGVSSDLVSQSALGAELPSDKDAAALPEGWRKDVMLPILGNIMRGQQPSDIEKKQISTIINEVLKLHQRAGRLKTKGFLSFFKRNPNRKSPDKSIGFYLDKYESVGKRWLSNQNILWQQVRSTFPEIIIKMKY
jgi:hypothetical protein